jgi:dissimilatory sulfite reductase (desulfoviridin) alpha/beta subunit
MQKGKITIMSVIVFCILVLGAMMAYKYLANAIDNKQIKKEIHDEIGVIRGYQLTEARIEETVGKVLNKRSLQPLEVFSEFKSNGKIHFSYKYEVSINYILFKHIEKVEVEEEMDNYGG